MSQQTIPLQAKATSQWCSVERRAFVRYPTQQETFCKPFRAKSSMESEMCWKATIHDISLGGVGLSLGRRFEPGTILSVELPTSTGGSIRILPVRVIHATATGPRLWAVGCAFVYPLAEEELQALLQGDN